MRIPVWARSRHQRTDRPAVVDLYAFSVGPLAGDEPLSLSRFGAPHAESVEWQDVRTHGRGPDPAWFDGWRTGSLRTIADRDLFDSGKLDDATGCHSVRVSLPDPADLAHLQAAWAVARWLVARGAFAVLDAHAGRWFDGAVLAGWAPDREFDADLEVSVVAETEPVAGFGHPVHTRGLAKFARPDLVTGVRADELVPAHQALRPVIADLADGGTLDPGTVLTAENGQQFKLVPYQPDVNAPQLNLSADGLLLIPA